VKVVSPAGNQEILGPDYSARISDDGHILVSKEKEIKSSITWKNGMFSFTARKLRSVLDEIQRQYGIAVTFENGTEYLFTGYFSKDKPVEEALELVCKPFGLTFVKRSSGEYEIIHN
jgi:ferric-dicitrate binding protein FerR (iron transport regulator)